MRLLLFALPALVLFNLFSVSDILAQNQRSDAPSLYIQTAEPNYVIGVADFSPNGKYFTTAMEYDCVFRECDGVRLWSVEGGRELRHFAVDAAIQALEFSHDSKYALAAGYDDEAVRMWNVETSEIKQRFNIPETSITSIQLTPDDKTLVVATDGAQIQLWSVESGHQIGEVEGEYAQVTAMVVSQSGGHLITGHEDGSASVWSLPSGDRVATLEIKLGSITAVAAAPSGELIAVADDRGVVQLFHAETGQEYRRFNLRTPDIAVVEFLASGQDVLVGTQNSTDGVFYACYGADGGVRSLDHRMNLTTRLWDVISISPSAHHAITDMGLVRLGKIAQHESVRFDHYDDVANADSLTWNLSTVNHALSPSGRLLATWSSHEEEGRVRLWSTETRKSLWDRRDGNGEVFFLSENRLLISEAGLVPGDSEWMRAISTEDGKEIWSDTSQGVVYPTFSADGKFILNTKCGAEGCEANRWDIQTGERTSLRLGGGTWRQMRSITALKDSFILTGWSDGSVALWSTESMSEVWRADSITSDAVQGIAVSPDERQALVIGEDGSATIVSTAEGQVEQRLSGHAGGIASWAFSPDGKHVATGGEEGTVKLWSVSTGEMYWNAETTGSRVPSVSFSPTGRYVISTDQLWETVSGRAKLPVGSRTWADVEFSPDEVYAITWRYSEGAEGWAELDDEADLWNLSTGQIIHTFKDLSEVSRPSLSTNGRLFLTHHDNNFPDSDYHSKLWKLTEEIALVDSLAIAPMTPGGFSPDGRYLFVGTLRSPHILRTDDLEVRIRLIGDYLLEDRFEGGDSDRITSFTFSGDGGFLITGHRDGFVRIWSTESGTFIRRFQAGRGEVVKVRLSSDGNFILANTQDSDPALWTFETGEEQIRFESPDWWGLKKYRLMSGSRKVLLQDFFDPILWTVGNGEVFRLETEEVEGLSLIKVSGAGSFVLAGWSDGSVALWSTDSMSEVWRADSIASDAVQGIEVSPDERLTLIISEDGSATIVSTTDGQVEQRVSGHAGGIASWAFSPDGKHVATGGEEGGVKLWSVSTGEMRWNVEIGGLLSRGILFSPDGQFVLVESADSEMYLLDTRSGWDVWHDDNPGLIHFSPGGKYMLEGGRLRDIHASPPRQVGQYLGDLADLSPDGRYLIIAKGPRPGYVELRPIDSVTRDGPTVVPFGGNAERVKFTATSPGGDYLLATAGDLTAHVWSMRRGGGHSLLTAEPLFAGSLSGFIRSASFSQEGDYLLTAEVDGMIHLYHPDTGDELWKAGDVEREIEQAAISRNGHYFVTGASDGKIRLWTNPLKDIPQRNWTYRVDSLSTKSELGFSPNGEHVLIGGYPEGHRYQILVLNAATGNEVFNTNQKEVKEWVSPSGSIDSWHWGENPSQIAFYQFLFGSIYILKIDLSNDSLWTQKLDLVKDRYVVYDRYDPSTWENSNPHPDYEERLIAYTFSPQGRHLFALQADGTMMLANLESREVEKRWETSITGDIFTVKSLQLLAGARLAVIVNEDGRMSLWSTESGKEIGTLLPFTNGSWAFIGSNGRFDTNSFANLRHFHWELPQYPLEPVTAESYTRDFFEPALLSRLVAGEEFGGIEGIADRNAVQPVVEITSVEAIPSDSTFEVTVKVSNRVYRTTKNGAERALESGAHDLRLFRDGQLAGYVDGDLGLSEEDSTLTHTFTGIRLPRRASVDEVEFSAYAFNSDRVKSSTARLSYPVPKALGLHKGRAYVITLGVDAFADSTWNLDFAAADARLLSETISNRLRESRRYDEVVPVPLIAAQESSTDARKAVIRSALDLLAGRTVGPALRARIPNADQIETATPEDLVLFSASTHGYTDSTGVFYLFPQDIETVSGEKNRITPSLLRSAISSDELSLWLRDVDAGTLTMIVDACHSAAAVEGAGFKPGPMGSRGLGQLAYNKGMQILAASQASDVAWESALLGHGLLTHALVRDGLISGQSDHAPEDGQVGLTEWLQYGAERVPALYEEVQEGRIQTFGRGGETSRSTVVGRRTRDAYFQRPSLFDFRRRTDDVVLQFE